jgi:intracellular septation protein A
MTGTQTPAAALLVRAGGIRGLVYTALPVTMFAAANAIVGLVPALIASVTAAAIVLVWQLVRRESTRPAMFGFAGIAVGAGLALVTGRAKDFYLPGIWMYLAMAIVFTGSVVVGRPLIGEVWAWLTGRDSTWRRTRRVRRAFFLVTLMMAAVSATRFAVQYYLYDTDQEGLLALARIAMGWPIFLVTSTLIYLAIRTAMRTLPRGVDVA